MRRFTADVSHELRTPLTAIRSVGEVGLRGHRDDAGYRTIVGSMLEEADRLATLVDRLLTLSRAETGAGDADEGRRRAAAPRGRRRRSAFGAGRRKGADDRDRQRRGAGGDGRSRRYCGRRSSTLSTTPSSSRRAADASGAAHQRECPRGVHRRHRLRPGHSRRSERRISSTASTACRPTPALRRYRPRTVDRQEAQWKRTADGSRSSARVCTVLRSALQCLGSIVSRRGGLVENRQFGCLGFAERNRFARWTTGATPLGVLRSIHAASITRINPAFNHHQSTTIQRSRNPRSKIDCYTSRAVVTDSIYCRVNREVGAKPTRSRHCKRRTAVEVTAPQGRGKTNGASSPRARRPLIRCRSLSALWRDTGASDAGEETIMVRLRTHGGSSSARRRSGSHPFRCTNSRPGATGDSDWRRHRRLRGATGRRDCRCRRRGTIHWQRGHDRKRTGTVWRFLQMSPSTCGYDAPALPMLQCTAWRVRDAM